MLLELKIKSFGIIDELIWKPSMSFNVITGETGAGKSLVIDAVEALLDGRLAEEDIRFGADSARIEAVFSLDKNPLLPHLCDLLKQNGIAADEDTVIMSCEFRRQGRTVLRVNGNAVPRALLREIGSLIVDVHAQSQHLSLFDRRQHINYLDAYAGSMPQRIAFAENTMRLYALQDAWSNIHKAASEHLHRQEMLRYQHDEITRAKLKDGEEEELEQQRRIMLSCEKLKAFSYEACRALNGDDEPVALSRIHEAVRAVSNMVILDQSLKSKVDALKAAAVDIEEVARDILVYGEELEYDSGQLDRISERLEQIHALKKKFGATVAQILEKQLMIEAELAELDSMGGETQRLENDIMQLRTEMGLQAHELSQKRIQAIARIEKAVENELSELGMAHVRFSVRMTQKEITDGLPYCGKTVVYAKDGVDDVEFMVSTNQGEPFKPLADIASTGEISRFTLALKVALAEADATPVVVFDEIDIGVGGRSGDVIGKKLWNLACHHQVICITHLPQIAAYATMHFNVSKDVSGKRTTSTIDALDANTRINELAAMLGGVEVGETARMNAVELLDKAAAWIKTQGSNALCNH